MDTLNRLLGAQCQIIAASGVTAIKTRYQAYGCKVRVDNTQITSVTKVENDDAATGAVTGESWMDINLIAAEYISFEDPIISITLGSGTPSVMMFLEPRLNG